MNIAINGLGRIGRATLKILLDKANTNPEQEINIVAINDIASIENLVYLLKFDTVYGIYNRRVTHDDNSIIIDDRIIKVYSDKDPLNLPWADLNIDAVIECTGKFLDTNSSVKHIKAGAKRVILSAPAKDDHIQTSIMGANHEDINQKVISNASCTTNSITPILKVLDDAFGVEKAMLTTAHAYTASQSIVDSTTGGNDFRKARAGAQNIIPSTTGAAIATTKVLTNLKGKFDGVALRVPVTCGSISDITFLSKKEVTVEEVNEAIRKAANTPRYNNIIGFTTDQIVSSDIIGTSFSCIIDGLMTRVVDKNLVKVMCWYDNEWAYSTRLAETTIYQCNI